MAVVINEFEVVAETPEPAAPSPRPEGAPPRPAIAAQEVERLLRHEEERALRLWAH